MTIDWCRHCGEVREMTLEHLPAKSSGNDQETRLFNDQGSIVRTFAEGHALPNLCRPCNNGAEHRRLPGEFKPWKEQTIEAIFKHSRRGGGIDPFAGDTPVVVPHDYGLHPGRLVRYAIGMVLAVQQAPTLMSLHPELVAAYRTDEPTSLATLRIHLALINAPGAYFSHVVSQVTMDRLTRTSRQQPLWVAGFLPFLVAIGEGNEAPWRSLDITPWLSFDTKYHFRKIDHVVSYPVADRRSLLVQQFYSARPTNERL